MFTVLKNYLDNMSKTVKKEYVVDSFENIMLTMKEDVIPSLDNMIKDADEDFIKDNQFLKNLGKLSIRTKDNKEYLMKIRVILNNIIKEEHTIVKLIDKELSTYVTSRGATAKDLTIMKLVTDIGAFSFYILDLCYFVLIGKDDTNYPKIKLTEIRERSVSFIAIVNVFHKNFDKYVKDTFRVAEEIVDKESASTSMMDKLFQSRGKFISMPTSGFNGNPIYHIRMWLIDKEIERYELLKEKKKLIELKLLELKLRQQQENNPKLKSQIEYYEDKISRLEYNIKEIADDEGGVTDYIPIVL